MTEATEAKTLQNSKARFSAMVTAKLESDVLETLKKQMSIVAKLAGLKTNADESGVFLGIRKETGEIFLSAIGYKTAFFKAQISETAESTYKTSQIFGYMVNPKQLAGYLSQCNETGARLEFGEGMFIDTMRHFRIVRGNGDAFYSMSGQFTDELPKEICDDFGEFLFSMPCDMLEFIYNKMVKNFTSKKRDSWGIDGRLYFFEQDKKLTLFTIANKNGFVRFIKTGMEFIAGVNFGIYAHDLARVLENKEIDLQGGVVNFYKNAMEITDTTGATYIINITEGDRNAESAKKFIDGCETSSPYMLTRGEILELINDENADMFKRHYKNGDSFQGYKHHAILFSEMVGDALMFSAIVKKK